MKGMLECLTGYFHLKMIENAERFKILNKADVGDKSATHFITKFLLLANACNFAA